MSKLSISELNYLTKIYNNIENDKRNKCLTWKKIFKVYYPIFIEYNIVNLKEINEYEVLKNDLEGKEIVEFIDKIKVISLSNSFLWHTVNLYRKIKCLPSLEEVNNIKE